MKEKILNDLKEAMKNKDKQLLSVIRMVKGDITLEEINKKKTLSDNDVIAIISKQIKTRKESIKEFEKGNREDLINQTEEEIKILEKYLPKQLTKEEVIIILDDAFKQINPTSMKDMGNIMKIITPKVRGKYDMSEISKMIKDKLI